MSGSDRTDRIIKNWNLDDAQAETLWAFYREGINASYHYADDSCKEWGLASKHERQCLEIFDANPEMHGAMRELASGGFLWSLSMHRPLEDKE